MSLILNKRTSLSLQNVKLSWNWCWLLTMLLFRVAIVRQNEALGFLPWEIYKIWDAHTLILSCKTTFWLSNFWGKVFILWLNSTNLYNFYAISLLVPDVAIDIATHSLSVFFLKYFCFSVGIKVKKILQIHFQIQNHNH